MNKIYKVIWNAALGTWVAVSELAKGKTKSSKVKAIVGTASIGLMVTFSADAGAAWISGSANTGTAYGTASATGVALGSSTSNKAAASGENSIALGNNSNAVGNNAISLGGVSTDGTTISFGDLGESYNGSVVARYSTSLGSTNKVVSGSSVAIGNRISILNNNNPSTLADLNDGGKMYGTTTSSHAVGIGDNLTINGGSRYAVAIGADIVINQNSTDSFAFGRGAIIGTATQSAEGGVAIGAVSKAQKTKATAIGSGNVASGAYSTAIGSGGTSVTQATADGALALGGNATAGAKASATNAIAIGGQSVASANKSVAIGTGSSSISGEAGIALGAESLAHNRGVSIGGKATSSSTSNQAISIGYATSVIGDQSIAIGANTIAEGNSSISIGGDDLLAVSGYIDNVNTQLNTSTIANTYKTLTGDNLVDKNNLYVATVSGEGSVAVGIQATAGDLATAFGTRSNAKGVTSVALGVGATASKDGAVALGAGAKTDTNATKETSASINGVTYSGFTGSTNLAEGSQVSVGSTGYESQIKNVAAGAVSASSTDAINGSQLYAVALGLDTVTDTLGTKVASLIGGGSKYDPVTGTISDPSFTINGAEVSTLSAAISSLNSGLTHFFSVNNNDSTLDNYYNNGATGLNAIAIGVRAQAKAENGIAIGDSAIANSPYVIAIGERAGPTPNTLTQAPGSENTDDSDTFGIYIGSEAGRNSAGSNNMMIGSNSAGLASQGSGNMMLGSQAGVAYVGDDNVMLGTFAGTGGGSGDTNVMIGYGAIVSNGNNNLALGKFAEVTNGNDSIAIGNEASTSANNSIAIGKGVKALDAAIAAIVMGQGAESSGENSIVLGSSSLANALNTIALGSGAQALAENAISIGTGNIVSGKNSGAIGDPSIIKGENSYSVGNNNTIGSTTSNAFALGNNINLGTDDSGADTKDVSGAVALGNKASVTEKGGVALGENSISDRIIGQKGIDPITGQETTLTGSTWASTSGAVAIGGGTTTRQITGLAAGTNDTDAVNVAQLKAGATHFFSVNNTDTASQNYDNKGAKGANAIAIGVNASAISKDNIAIGTNAKAEVGVGSGTTDNGNSIAIGTNTYTKGLNQTAIGSNAKTSNNQATAIGFNASSLGAGSAAVGAGTSALGTGSTAMSAGAAIKDFKVLGTDNIGFRAIKVDAKYTAGTASKVSGSFTNNGLASTAFEFDVDETGKITAGKLGTKTLTADEANSVYTALSMGSAIATDNNATAVGYSSIATADGANAIGSGATASAKDAVAIGRSVSSAQNAVAIGMAAVANGQSSVAVGNNTNADAQYAVALGGGGNGGLSAKTTANKEGAVAIGGNATAGAKASATNAIAIGGQSVASVDKSVALGLGATASKAGAVALGAGAKTDTNATKETSASINGVTYSGFTGSTNIAAGSQVSVGSTGYESQIKNLAAGAVSASSTDAINGSQLYAVALGLDTTIDTLGGGIASIIGGGSKYDPLTGTISDPNYVINKTDGSAYAAVNNVSAALTNLNTEIAKPLTFKDAGTGTSTNPLGSELSIVGDSNITTTVTQGQAAIALNKNVVVDSVTAGTVDPTTGDLIEGSQLTAAGTEVKDAAGNTATYGADEAELSDGTNTNTITASSNSITDGKSTTTVGADTITVGAGSNPVVINGQDGVITGLTNTTLDDIDDTDPTAAGQAATQGQVSELITSGLKLNSKDGTAAEDTVALGEAITVTNTDGNLVATHDDNQIIYDLAKDISVESVTAGTVDPDTGELVEGSQLTATGTEVKDADGNVANYGADKAEISDGTNTTTTTAGGTTVTDGTNTNTITAGSNSITDGKSTTTVGADTITVGAGSNPVVINGQDGVITGLTNTTLDDIDDTDPTAAGQAATQGQVSELITSGLKLNSKDGTAAEDTVALGEAITVTNTDGNLVATHDDNQIIYDLAKDISVESVTAGTVDPDTGELVEGSQLTATGTEVKDADGNVANYGADKAEISDGTNTTTTTAGGTKITDGTNTNTITAGSNSITDGKSATTVGADTITVGAGSKPVVINGQDGVITGLTNTTLDDIDDTDPTAAGQAATQGQVSELITSGLKLNSKDGTAAEDTVALGEAITVTNTDGNLVATHDDNQIIYDLAKDISVESVTAGTVDPDTGELVEGIQLTATGTEVKDADGNVANYGADKAEISDGTNTTTTTAGGTTVTDGTNTNTITAGSNSITDGKSTTTVGADTITVGAGSNPVVINGQDGVITGLTNTTLDDIDDTDPTAAGQAATQGQVSELITSGLKLNSKDGTAAEDTVALGEAITVTNTDGNLVATHDDNQIIYDLAKDISVESVTAGTVDPDTGELVEGIQLTATGTEVKDADGNVANYGADKAEISDGTNTTTTTAGGTTVTDGTNTNTITAGSNSITDGKSTTTVGADTITVGAGSNPVVINGQDGVITGLTNTTLDDIDDTDPTAAGQAATQGQVSELITSGLKLNSKDGTAAEDTVALGEAITVTNTDGNLVATHDDNQIIYDLAKDISVESVTAGTVDPDTGELVEGSQLTATGTEVKDADGNVANYGADKAEISDGTNTTTTTAGGTTVTDGTNTNTITAGSNSITDGKSTTTVGADTITVGAGSNPVVINGQDGVITGLTNTTLDDIDDTDPTAAGQAATQGQVSELITSGLKLNSKDGTAAEDTVALGEAITVTNTDGNLVATHDDNQIIYDLAKDISVESVTAGTVDPDTGELVEGIQLTATGTEVKDADGNVANYGADKAEISDGTNTTTTTAGGTTVTDGTNTNTITAGSNSITDGKSTTTVGADTITVGAGSNPVVINGQDGVITGLTNTTLDDIDDTDPTAAGQAATQGQVSELITSGLKLNSKDGTAAEDTVALGEAITVTNTDGNLVATHDDNQIIYDLAKDISVESVTAGTVDPDTGELVEGSQLTATGTEVKDADGNVANYGADKAEISDGTNTTTTTAGGTKITDGTNTNTITAGSNSITDGKSATTVGADTITVGAGSKPVVINGQDGVITGLTNTTLDDIDDTDPTAAGQAATQGQVSELITSGLKLNSKDGTAAEDTVALGEAITVTNTDGNLVATHDDNQIIYDLAKDISVESVTAGTVDPDTGELVEGIQLTATGTEVKDADGNVANYGADKAEISDGTNTTTTTAGGTTVTDGTNTNTITAGSNSITDGKSTTTVGADTITVGAGSNPVVINGQDGVITGLTNNNT
ncbi:ESPR-type extended signal peptide-containing protein [Acinetobacter lanii]|uniref:Uncharacterized protein n=1 Tax=Acinetobacter lanii TaxID=2715163 RepID=A0A6G8S8I6_9GAMM|nr:ESPR-type extended signal peptide-containing protein [Acinetobacter lanii]QIO10243.1 hypothetical protein G8D99_15325 [Acinetobacter lanii]